MRADVTDAATIKLMAAYQGHDFSLGRCARLWQITQQAKYFDSSCEVAERDLADYARVRKNLAGLQDRCEIWISGAEVIDPN